MIQLDIRSRTKNPTPTSGVVRNPTPTPPNNLRIRIRLRNPGSFRSSSFLSKAMFLREKPGDHLMNVRKTVYAT